MQLIRYDDGCLVRGRRTEGIVAKIIYGLAALILLILKFAEGVPSLQKFLPIGGSFFYEVGVIFGPAVLIDQSIAWLQSCIEAHRKQQDRRRRARERNLRRQKQQQTKAA
jgi:hypothetical protein